MCEQCYKMGASCIQHLSLLLYFALAPLFILPTWGPLVSGHRPSCVWQGICKLCVQRESLLCWWFPHLAGNLLEVRSPPEWQSLGMGPWNLAAPRLEPKELSVCRQHEWGPLVAIPFWMLVLDQEGTDSFGQIAFFPFFFSDLLRLIKSPRRGGFPGGAVGENLPANAGDTGSSPGLGRSHMPRSN